MYIDTSPSPSILHVNRQIYDESIDFVRKYQPMFSINISGKESNFDEFSLWCFKIKGCELEINEMKYLTLNISPPNPSRPIDMWHIWHHVQRFCKENAADPRVPHLTVRFIEMTELDGRQTVCFTPLWDSLVTKNACTVTTSARYLLCYVISSTVSRKLNSFSLAPTVFRNTAQITRSN